MEVEEEEERKKERRTYIHTKWVEGKRQAKRNQYRARKTQTRIRVLYTRSMRTYI
jgi:hypothetical protein